MSLDEWVQMQPLYESWSLTNPSVPPRSQLYSLQPIGVGTGMVESLTSYVARLAEAHWVSVGDLVGRVLAGLANPKDGIVTAAAKAVRVGGHGFHACSYAINGVGDRAARWVDALEGATTRRELRCLTLLPFRCALPDHLFRRRRAWCSLCFEQWRASKQIVYEPLLWAVEVSSHCTVHARLLDGICRHCRRTLSPLGVFSRPGYCEICGGWLGASNTDDKQSRGGSAITEIEIWSSIQVGGLLAILPQIDAAAARESFRRSLVVYLDQVTQGNVLALAQHIRCPRGILQNWLRGATVPRLETLLRTCRYLNIPAASLFDSLGPTSVHIAAAKEAVALTGARDVSPSRTANEIQQALLAALNEGVPRSLSEVARSLGYKDTERLYQADRKLCHEIAARYRKSGLSHWWRKPGAVRICDAARLKHILEQSLKSNLPTSVHQIAASLGYSNDGYVHQKYPELCRAIGAKIALAKKGEPDRMRRTLEEALHEHPAPTLIELSRRLGYSSSTVLRAHEPDLCDQLLARHRAHVLECRADLEKRAVASLTEIPAPSVRDVCKRIGISAFFMDKHFPVVRQAIAENHRRWALSATAQRREKLFLAIRNIAADLHRRGRYPSANKIVERLPPGSCCEWKAVNLAVHEARRALGFPE
jgi:AraC-like DNA-binding protein